MEANQDDSMEDSLEPGCYKREPSGNTKDASIPLAAFHPKLGLMDMDTSFLRSTKSGGKSLEPTRITKEVGTGLEDSQTNKEDQNEPEPIPVESQFVVHGAEGAYLMDKNKWPKLLLALETQEGEAMESLTQEESITREIGVPVPVEEDLMENLSYQSTYSDLEDTNQGGRCPKAEKPRKTRRRKWWWPQGLAVGFPGMAFLLLRKR